MYNIWDWKKAIQDCDSQIVFYIFEIKDNTSLTFSGTINNPMFPIIIIKFLKLAKLWLKQQPKHGLPRLLPSLFVEHGWQVVIQVIKTFFCNLQFAILWVCNVDTQFKLRLSIVNPIVIILLLINKCYKEVLSSHWSFLLIQEISKSMAKMICETPKFWSLGQVLALWHIGFFPKLSKIT